MIESENKLRGKAVKNNNRKSEFKPGNLDVNLTHLILIWVEGKSLDGFASPSGELDVEEHSWLRLAHKCLLHIKIRSAWGELAPGDGATSYVAADIHSSSHATVN